jgi:hypothetical protein
MHENFDEAVARFQRFLKDQNLPEKIIWLEPKDVLLSDSKVVYVNLQTVRRNEQRARHAFEAGLHRGLGVLIKGVFKMEDAICSHVWIPSDATETEYALIAPGTKLSVPNDGDGLRGEPVRSRLRWLYLRIRHWSKQALKHQLFD